MASRATSKFGAPMFELRSFGTCDIVGTSPHPPAAIRRRHSDSAPGELCPLDLRVVDLASGHSLIEAWIALIESNLLHP